MKGKRKEKTVITTGVVAAHCQVSYDTVKHWIRQGKLPAYETPGRRHYILIDEFKAFLKAYGMPPFEAPQPRKRKVLVVDDEAELVKTIMAFFEATGEYTCASAADGYEAGKQMMKFDPSLVVLDVIMPYLNGIEICRKIKTTLDTRHILVLAITGYPEEGYGEQVLAAGADDCLIKPFPLETLKQRVDALFARQRNST